MKKRILSLLALFCGFFGSTSAIYGGNETQKKQSNDNYLTFTNNSTNSVTINLKRVASVYTIPTVSLVYSTDNGNTWNDFAKETEYTIEAGKSLKVVAGSNGKPGETINKGFNESSKLLAFSFLNSSSKTLTDPVISISGDITSLLNGVGGDVDLSSTEDGANYEYCFHSLFNTCKCITTAPNLPSTKLAMRCYSSLFSECSSLVSAPSLPATTLVQGCYDNMFYKCSSLVSAPSLPATTLADECYTRMFSGCSKLVSAPSLPASKLKPTCYASMFSSCTSLVKIPDLSHVTSIDSSFSYMFAGCTKLTITTSGTKNWSIGTSSTTGTIPSTMFDNCTNVNFGSGSKTPTKGTKYVLKISSINFELTSPICGYYKKDGNKQAMCAFGVTCISDNISNITEFGFAVYNGSSYEDTIKTTDTEKIKDLVNLGGRFYTVIDCDDAGVTKKVKAYAKINSTRYTSNVMSATSNLDTEYKI